MKNNWHDDSGMRKNRAQDTEARKFQETNQEWREGRASDRRRIAHKFHALK